MTVFKVGREHGDGVERSCGAGGEGRAVIPCSLVVEGAGGGRVAETDAPGSREARERFCRYVLINQLYIYFFDPLVRAEYFPYFPIFPAAAAAKSSGW